MNPFSVTKRIYSKIKKHGFLTSISIIKKYGFVNLFLSSLKKEIEIINKDRIIFNLQDFIIYKPFHSENKEPIKKNTINWVIPDFIANGSGGHLNIFRMVSNLEKLGFENRIIIVEGSHFYSGKEAKTVIEKNYLPEEYLPLKAEVTIGRSTMLPAEFTIATEWKTAYPVRDFQSTKHKCYFVQDFEPYFFSPGSFYIFAENTYSFGFKGITAGSWISNKLMKEYKMQCCPLSFSYDKKLYYMNDTERKRVFFYVRPGTTRRGFELGILALAELKKRIADAEIILGGASIENIEIPFDYIGMGNISITELPEIYNTVKVALVLSFTNLSLLPYELMACGCAVVINKGENNEWGINEKICSIVEPDAGKITGAIYSLLTEEKKRKEMVANALNFINKTDWFSESKKMADYLGKISSEKN